MKADKFVQLMRTIISEEVRRVVREELKLSLTEQRQSDSAQSSFMPGSMKNKYKSLLEDDVFEMESPKQRVSNITSNKTVNSLLEETAQQMRTDPAAKSFFEGL
jgi:hypothetical protein